MKPLVLLSFSLTFLTQGFADEFSAAEPSKQISAEEQNSNLANEEKLQGSMPSEAEDSEKKPHADIPLQSEDSPEWCLSPYHEMHASIRHNEAKGIGYKDGYTTLEVFGIYDGYGSGFMPFGDIRGHVFNDGKLAGNLGIGERTFLTSINHTFGSYLYYDVRRVGHGLTVNQLSPGIELVGERMEYRINGYFPLGKQKGRKYGHAFDEFKGHSILLKYKQQQAMTGGDAEVGVHIPQNTTYDVYAAAGPYYFRSSNAQSWGGRARLLGRYKEYVSLEVAYSYDKLFRSVVQGSIAFTVPFGGKLKRCGPCCPQTDNLLLSRAAFAPSRFEIPVVKKVHKQEKAIDPATGQPRVVWFVDNTSHSAGTFESPFPTLAQAQAASGPNDIIYVFPGDGTSNGMNAGITLQNNQALYGAGNVHDINTTLGSIRIPAFSSTAPLLTNGSGNIINLANSNEVSGMNLLVTQAGSTAINGISNIYGANINNNTILGNVDHYGVFIVGSGSFNISNNQVTGILNATLRGIRIGIQDGLFAKISINNNICSGYNIGISAGPFLNPNTSTGDITISGNLVSNFSMAGILYPTGMANSTARITNNTAHDNGSMGGGVTTGSFVASVNLFPDAGTVILDNNTVTTTSTNPAVFGILGEVNIADGTSTQFVITNNRIQAGTGTGSVGIEVRAASSDTICSTITNNQVQLQAATGTNGINIQPSANAIINIDDFSNNVAPNVLLNGSGTINFIAPNTCQ